MLALGWLECESAKGAWLSWEWIRPEQCSWLYTTAGFDADCSVCLGVSGPETTGVLLDGAIDPVEEYRSRGGFLLFLRLPREGLIF